MTLDDFEKSLADEKRAKEQEEINAIDEGRRKRRKHHHHHHRHHFDGEERHNNQRPKHSSNNNEKETYDSNTKKKGRGDEADKEGSAADGFSVSKSSAKQNAAPTLNELKRDSWMEAPSTIGIDYTQKGLKKPSQPSMSTSSKADFALKIHDNELNKHHLRDLADGKEMSDKPNRESTQNEVGYTFGDRGARWRMTKLKGVYRRAKDTGRPVEELAIDQFGDLRAFDEAREEQIELERRETYGKGYVVKEKPSGELFEERKLEMGASHQGEDTSNGDVDDEPQLQVVETSTVQFDQTALNRMKAQMMKARMRGSSDLAALEAEYSAALKSTSNQAPAQTVVLGAMDNRMVAGGRRGEVKAVENKRGRERGLVEENEDMSIEDMVREERRTRNQAGGDSHRFAERIAKDAKFDNNLDYMDENAARLAKRVLKSEINLKNTAISDFHKINRALDTCPLCHHDDTNAPPVAPVVSLATRTYLTLPTEPEISDGGACVIPLQHRGNLLECDDDEWEEIRNFMKSLIRMYHDQGRDVIFYENAATPQRRKHAALNVVPLPYSLGETAPAFFKEAILSSDEEWTQHKKLIDTLTKSKDGLGKSAFRRTMVKEMPYFHVWFEIDGGLGHIVEDANRWPKGDLFAREIVGGMLDRPPDVVRRQGRWIRGDPRVDGFRKRWKRFDWTRVLTDG